MEKFRASWLLRPFSYWFHPILVPVYAISAFLYFTDFIFEPMQIALLYLEVVILLVFIPLCGFFLLKTLGKADSMMLPDVSQRKVPLAIQSLLIAVLIAQGFTVDALPELHFFFLGALFSTVTALLLAIFRIRASLHMMAMVPLSAYLMLLSVHHQINALGLIAFSLLATGLTAASRLELKAHSTKELILGALIGLLPQVALGYLWL